MKVRAIYCLTCWGYAHQMKLNDWKKVADVWAEDGVNQVYFWLAGLFHSKTYPQTFIYYDTGMDTKDIHKLIKYIQRKGMKFFIGTGLFAWFGLEEMVKVYPEIEAKVNPKMPPDVLNYWTNGHCPSNEKAREINLNYCLELAEEFPEADGFFLEMRDEWGPCMCGKCDKIVGSYGEKGYSLAKVTFLKELSAALWKKKPSFEFVVSACFIEQTGDWDIAYYQWIKSLKFNLRWYFLNARWAESFPDLDGNKHPITELSNQLIYWSNKYSYSLMDVLGDFRKGKRLSAGDFCYTFEPGYRWQLMPASDIPDTLESISTKLYRLAFKEFCENPEISNEEFKKKIFNQLFKPNENKELLTMLLTVQRWYLRIISQTGLIEKVETLSFPWQQEEVGKWGSIETRLIKLRSFREEILADLFDIQKRLKNKKLSNCPGLVLLNEGITICEQIASKEFLRKLDILLEQIRYAKKSKET